MRIGHGYDVHRLVEGRRLVLGGVEINYTLGLLGHSDADVVTHALMDSLLGAAGLGDIGRHFPDTDKAYEGISSMMLLSRVMAMLRGRGFGLVNADITIIAERPRLAPHMEQIAASLCAATGCESINVKATTEEGLGFSGNAIACHCVCLIEEQ